MTFRTESRIMIAGTVYEVYAYLCDVRRWPEWAPTVLEGRVRGGGPLQPGSRVEQRAKLILGMSRSRSQEVTVVEPPRSLGFAGPIGTSAARWGMEFEPADDGQTDRKSTRLNSSHSQISYAVFCLKKKKHTNNVRTSKRE